MWLIPRLEMFQRAHPDIDIRIDATDVTVDLDTTDVDMAQHARVQASDTHRSKHMEWLTWQRWFDAQGLKSFAPKRCLYFNYAHQIAQAALTGQGIALPPCRWWQTAWLQAIWLSRCPACGLIRRWLIPFLNHPCRCCFA